MPKIPEAPLAVPHNTGRMPAHAAAAGGGGGAFGMDGGGWRIAGAALERFGSRAYQIMEQMENEKDHDDLVGAQAKYTEAMTAWETEQQQSRTGQGAANYTKDFRAKHEELIKAHSEGLSKRAARAFGVWGMRTGAHGSGEAARYEHAQRKLYGKDMHNLRVDQAFNIVEKNPADFARAQRDLAESFRLGIDQGIYRPEEAAFLNAQAQDKLRKSAFENLYAADRAQAMRSMDILGMSEHEKARAKKRLRADQRAEASLSLGLENREIKRQRDAAERDLYTLSFDGKLTREAVEAKRDTLSPERYNKFLKLTLPGANAPKHSDPDYFVRLFAMAVGGDAELQEEAIGAFLNRKITEADFKFIAHEGQKFLEPDARRAVEHIKTVTRMDELGKIPGSRENQANALRDLARMMQTEEWKKAPAHSRAREDMYVNLGRVYQLFDLEKFLLAAQPPVNLVGTRSKPDAKATLAKIQEKHGAGLLSDAQRLEEIAKLKKLVEINEKRNSATAKTEAQKLRP